jgi:hypothetical protein
LWRNVWRRESAARHAPKLEESAEKAMLKGAAGFGGLGATGVVVDVSGSMDSSISGSLKYKP